MAGIRCGRCQNYHLTVADVRRCFNGVVKVAIVDQDPALRTSDGDKAGKFVRPTGPQLSYLKALLNTRSFALVQGVPNVAKSQISPLITVLRDGHPISNDARFRPVTAPRYCEDAECPSIPTVEVAKKRKIQRLCAAHAEAAKRADFDGELSFFALPVSTNETEGSPSEPRQTRSQRNAAKRDAFDPETLKDGFYVFDGEIAKVIVAHHGTGRKYAKRLNIKTGEWDMAHGLIWKLRPEMRMTLKEALSLAKRTGLNPQSELYGRCFVCGRTLTDDESIKNGIGPVCAGKFA